MAQIQIKELETATLYDLNDRERQGLVGGLIQADSTLAPKRATFVALAEAAMPFWVITGRRTIANAVINAAVA